MVRTILGRVVLSELFPHFIGCYADDRVLTRIEIRRKLEEFHSDRAFFESAALPLIVCLTMCSRNSLHRLLVRNAALSSRRLSSACTGRSCDSLSPVLSLSRIL